MTEILLRVALYPIKQTNISVCLFLFVENGRDASQGRSESPRIPTERRHGGEDEPNDDSHRRSRSVPSQRLNVNMI